MREILLSQGNGGRGRYAGYIARIDDDDYDLVAPYSWHVLPVSRMLYVARQWEDREGGQLLRQHNQLMHSLITGWSYVDHRDHNGLNNQRSNLREVTHQQNLWNMRSRAGSSSQYKGVSWYRAGNDWEAYIRLDGRKRRLGRFASETDAARAYDAVAREAFGEFACLNFPDD